MVQSQATSDAAKRLKAVKKIASAPLQQRLAVLKRAGIIDAKGSLRERYKDTATQSGQKKHPIR